MTKHRTKQTFPRPSQEAGERVSSPVVGSYVLDKLSVASYYPFLQIICAFVLRLTPFEMGSAEVYNSIYVNLQIE
jgi:hypothetical protein